MRGRSKRYKELEKVFPKEAFLGKEAVYAVKKNSKAKFDETIDVVIRLGIDPKKTEQKVRGILNLPSGATKKKRVAVFVSEKKKAAEALKKGAAIAGGEELIKKIKETEKCDFDVAVAEPRMMPKISQIAKILGPRGLMPNPKTGTISADPLKVLEELQGGKISFSSDESGLIHISIGKVSWEEDKILKNFEAATEAVKKAKPESVKQEFIKKVYISSSMGPSIEVKV